MILRRAASTSLRRLTLLHLQVMVVEFEADTAYSMDAQGRARSAAGPGGRPTGPQNTVNEFCYHKIVGGGPRGFPPHALYVAGRLLARRQQGLPATGLGRAVPAEFHAGKVVDVPTTFDGPSGPIVLRVDALICRDSDSFLSSRVTVFDCHETGAGNQPRAFGVVNRPQFIQQSGLRSLQGLILLMALLPERDGPSPATPITTAVRAALFTPLMEHHRVVLELCTGIGDIVASSVNTSDPFGTGEQAVGFVAKAFKRAVEAFVPGSVPFPGPLTPARARARAIVRAVYGFSAQQQAVVWRRAKNLQVYMA